VKDPLNPGPVAPMEEPDHEERASTDTRPWWIRALRSLRPSVSAGKNLRTGEKYEEVEIKGHIDF